ncbi:MAG: PKD domain-containing protein [Candidatus Magnetoglobus multicellularis str. Araruama]|uniref:PKD domain-containing protein n=1 Tax=Candidatus Magnetoglobus multicellularis str. Araruama TaxID=890399 RepID=A0A1V1P3T9_9BACT|nr:MAG: PKD domain-containing protein [Candidatus Magnetoglobus multicellularis str. Araruama]
MNWTATTDASWITIENSSGNNDGVINTIYPYNNVAERIGFITITAEGAADSPQTVTITQSVSRSPLYEQKLLSLDGEENVFFGSSVSISGDYAIVGANHDDDNGYSSGSAYIFRLDGDSWVEQVKLLPSDGAQYDFIGSSVSISGDYAIAGAYGDGDNGYKSGSAYIFRRDVDTWVEEVKLLASDGEAGDQFGSSVSISGDYIIVGAYENDDNGYKSGAAYIFRLDGDSWVEQAKLLPSDGAERDSFGSSVSISGGYVIVGAQYDDDNGNNSGSAYIFKLDGGSWVEQVKLLASDNAAGDFFGCSVSISGNYAIVGTDGDDENGNASGSVYIFRRDGDAWMEEAKLLASDGEAGDRFGASVSVSGDNITVGAYGDDENGYRSGSAYIFIKDGDTWVKHVKLLPSDGSENDSFGSSVSTSGGYVIVGATYDDNNNGNGSGAAYIFKSILTIPPILSVSPLTKEIRGSAYAESKAIKVSNLGSEKVGMPWTAATDASWITIENFSGNIYGDINIIYSYNNIAKRIGAITITAEGALNSPQFVTITQDVSTSPFHEQKLLASDGSESIPFGSTVSISGDYAIVGAEGDDDNGENSGSVYIFRKDGDFWVEQAKLFASDGSAYNFLVDLFQSQKVMQLLGR